MRYFKRLLSFGLVIMLSVVGFYPAHAEETIKISKEYNILSQLNIARDIDMQRSDITKLDYVKSVLRLLNIFVDGIYDDEILDYVIENDILKNLKSFEAKPSDVITCGEALYGIINVLGYKQKAEVKGGYPGGYLTVATELKLLAGVGSNFEKILTTENAVKLLYNAIQARYMNISSISDEDTRYEAIPNVTILTVFYDIAKGRGKVEATEISGLYSESGNVGQRQLKINSTVYSSDTANAYSLLGNQVEYYYIVEDMKIVAISADNTNIKTLRINADRIKTTTTTTSIKYEDALGIKEFSAAVNPNAAVILNGSASANFTNSTFQPACGEIELVDYDGGAYDLVRIWDYQTVWVKDFNIDTYTVYNNYGNIIELDRESGQIFDVTDETGNSMYLIDIKPKNVLLIAKNTSNTYTRIVASQKNSSGVISDYEESEDGTFITVNDERLKVSKFYENLVNNAKLDIHSGFSGKFYLNAYGEVCGVEKISSDTVHTGYLTDVTYKTDTINPYAMAKIYTTDKVMEVIKFADKVIFDSQSNRVSGQDIVNKFYDTDAEFAGSGSTVKRQLIQYQLNSKGEIREVDLAYKTSPLPGESIHSLKIDYNYSTDGGQMAYRSKLLSFGGKVVMSSSTVTFSVSPKNKAPEDKDYILGGTGLFADNKQHLIEAYSAGQDKLFSDYVIFYPSSNLYASDDRILVDRVTQAVNEDGEPVYKIYGFEITSVTGVKALTYICDRDVELFEKRPGDGKPMILPEMPKPGDVCDVYMDFNSNIKKIVPLFDIREKTLWKAATEKVVVDGVEVTKTYYIPQGSNTTGGWFAQYRLSVFAVIDKKDGILACEAGASINTTVRSELVNASKYRTKATFDIGTNKVKNGNINDVDSYNDVGENYSIVLCGSYYGEDRGIVIYKK